MHTKTTDFTTYTYKCYGQTQTGTVRSAAAVLGGGAAGVEQRITELEQQMMQYGDVKPATDEDVNGKLEALCRLMGQFTMPEDGEFTESDIDKYVSGVRVYGDHFEWLLNLDTDTRGELDDAGSPVYFKKITVTPDDERVVQSASAAVKIQQVCGAGGKDLYLKTKGTVRKGCAAVFPSCPALCSYTSETISFVPAGRQFPKSISLQSENPSR